MMRLYNTLTRREEDFVPSHDNTVRMYTCGLTVYNRGHIGNFRTFVCLDVLRRTLKYQLGYQIRQVMNFTDVDDRTIAGSLKARCRFANTPTNTSPCSIQDAEALGLEPVEENPRATDPANLDAMGAARPAAERRMVTPITATDRLFQDLDISRLRKAGSP